MMEEGRSARISSTGCTCHVVAAAAARSQGRHPAARAALPREVRRGEPQAGSS
jgi:hypothetical protein